MLGFQARHSISKACMALLLCVAIGLADAWGSVPKTGTQSNRPNRQNVAFTPLLNAHCPSLAQLVVAGGVLPNSVN